VRCGGLFKVERPQELGIKYGSTGPVEDCVNMSLKLSLLPIARQDVVIRHCKPKATDPTDDIDDLQAAALTGAGLRGR